MKNDMSVTKACIVMLCLAGLGGLSVGFAWFLFRGADALAVLAFGSIA